MFGKFKACLNSACSINFLTRKSIKSLLLRIQTPTRMGLKALSFPSHKSLVISFAEVKVVTYLKEDVSYVPC